MIPAGTIATKTQLSTKGLGSAACLTSRCQCFSEPTVCEMSTIGMALAVFLKYFPFDFYARLQSGGPHSAIPDLLCDQLRVSYCVVHNIIKNSLK